MTRFLLVAVTVISFALPTNTNAAGWPQEMLADAELTDVAFVDAKNGWAVGDRGAIWHTADGGRQWELQRSNVGCRLEKVQFVDVLNGWAAGSRLQPYVHKSKGVLLRTRDGGRHWEETRSPILPGLLSIKFFDKKQGWALTEPTALFPTGTFRTSDGGRTWIPLTGNAPGRPLTADFHNMKRGVIAGRDSQLLLVSGMQLTPSNAPSFGMRRLTDLQLAGPTGGVIVGDGGLIALTSDGGFSWQLPKKLPHSTARHFDFSSVAISGSHCWVVGSPGTFVFHSSDSGDHWEVQPTGQSLPIKSITFSDAQNGWAVGALGTILSTRDGGRSWQRQHTGGTRTAVLGIFDSPSKLSLEVFAKIAGNDGYLSTCEFLHRTDPQTPSSTEVHMARRAHAATIEVGASGGHSAWQFPLPSGGGELTTAQVVRAWDHAHDGRGQAEMMQTLVRRIRQWRPSVVLIKEPANVGSIDTLIQRLVMQAVNEAADSTKYPDQFTQAGLRSWRVVNVVSISRKTKSGSNVLTTTQIAPRLGRSLADQAEQARGLLAEQYQPSPVTVQLRSLRGRLATGGDWLAHLSLHPGGDARRELWNPVGDLNSLRRLAQRQRNAQQILAHSGENAQGGSVYLAQIGDLTRGQSPDKSGQILNYMARQFQKNGQNQLAAETFEFLCSAHPQHPLGGAARMWLVQFYASGEAGRRERGKSKVMVQQTGASETSHAHFEKIRQTVGHQSSKPLQVVTAGAQTQQQRSSAATQQAERARTAKALDFGKQVEAADPALYAEPALRFALSNAMRRHGHAGASRYFRQLALQTGQNDWADAARAELWIANPTPDAPKPVWKIANAPKPPKLDGKMQEPFWQEATAVELKGDESTSSAPTIALMARDAEFLYVAIGARKFPGSTYTPDKSKRPRDSDLSQNDRIELRIDVDRDYATCFKLTFDSRGFTHESCNGDVSWNPKWFVAAQQDEGLWWVEAAIPLSELVETSPTPRTTWAVSVQRLIPGQGGQTWCGPVIDHPRPAAFGLLTF